ncbi:hypothetical protein [Hymenobacter sp. GOD-10R]|uniref:hypothetical protein n=1 Tax=Hymenobacter sp. GOD-10R TaxID=3093922 RepID=UPI002D7A2A2A|nr:hypothetical protein [Hymenobacter sp. GOD-10R]WRQ28853.1 hypothetical protein SD425_01060 [Hymenobacter sp. GOD-10R]
MRHQLSAFAKTVSVLSLCMLGNAAYAQQEVSRIVTVHPIVGEVIDQQEKLAFGLFSAYRLDDFQKASFFRFASLDSTRGSILLQVTLRNGEVRTRSYSEREFQQVRNSIERQCQQTLYEQKQEERVVARKQALPPDTAAAPKYWYVGVGATYHSYNSVNRPYCEAEPLYLAIGYTIKPRVALQGEVRYSRQIKNLSNTSVLNGETYTYRTERDTRSTAVTLLARFRKSQTQRRLQFDWLAGITIVHGREKETTFQTSSTYSQTYNYPINKAIQPHLVGGISLRYLLAPHVTLGTQLLLNKNLVPFFFGWGTPFGGADIGVSYLFGDRKFAHAVK